MARTTRLSLEFFPPRDPAQDAALAQIMQQHGELDFVSITHTRGLMHRTLDIVGKLQAQTAIPLVPHLVARRLRRSQFGELVVQLQQLNIERLVVISGDIAGDADDCFTDSLDLLETIALSPLQDCDIAVGGYPEGHLVCGEDKDFDRDLDILLRKQDLGAGKVITQLCFDAEPLFRFRDRCTAAGLRLPITAGLLPVASTKNAANFCRRTGVDFPQLSPDIPETQRLAHYAEKMLALTHTLVCEHFAGIHLYTLNGETPTLPLAAEVHRLTANTADE